MFIAMFILIVSLIFPLGVWTGGNEDMAGRDSISESVDKLVHTALHDLDRAAREAAGVRLTKLGSEGQKAIPKLIKRLKDRNAVVRENAVEALALFRSAAQSAVPALIDALKDSNESVCSNVASALVRIGPKGDNARRAIPELLRVLRDKRQLDGTRGLAADALGEIGPFAIPALIEALKDKDVEVRRNAAAAFGRMKSKAASAVFDLLQALADPDGDVRSAAGTSLVDVGPSAVPGLTKTLGARDPHARFGAAYALIKMDRTNQAAIDTFIALLKVRDEEIRGFALRLGLLEAGPNAKKATPELILLLKDKNSKIREGAAMVLGDIGPSAKPAVTALTTSLADKDSGVRAFSARALALIGAESKPALPALVRAVKDEDEDVRSWAISALGNLGSEGKAGVPALINALADSEPSNRLTAMESLAKIGPDAKAAIPALRRLLRDHTRVHLEIWSDLHEEDHTISDVAAKALQKIEKVSPKK